MNLNYVLSLIERTNTLIKREIQREPTGWIELMFLDGSRLEQRQI